METDCRHKTCGLASLSAAIPGDSLAFRRFRTHRRLLPGGKQITANLSLTPRTELGVAAVVDRLIWRRGLISPSHPAR